MERRGKALVIGGTQFIGRHCVRALLDGGYDVTLLNRGKTPSPFDRNQKGVSYFVCDRLNDTARFKQFLSAHEFEVVVDFVCFDGCAAAASVSGLTRNNGTFGTNLYILISSDSVYMSTGVRTTDTPFIEESASSLRPSGDQAHALKQKDRYQYQYGRGFVFGRSDWEYVFNTFCFGYAVGYHFLKTSTGEMNANLLGIGADLAVNASILVDASQAPGLLITNGEFTAFHSSTWLPNSNVESTHVVVTDANAGPVKFTTSSFWGPSSQIADIAGSGTVSFQNCQFVEWDEQAKDGRAAIRTRSADASVIVSSSTFAQSKRQVDVSGGAQKLVFANNIVTGPCNITGKASAAHVVSANAC